jgi:hypothetical protein
MPRTSREFAAVPMIIALLGFLGLLMLAFTVGAWAWILLGVFTVAAGAFLTWWYASRHPHPGAEAAPPPAPSPDDGVFRVLVVADADCSAEALRQELASRLGSGPASALVIAPALSSRVGRWTGDEHAYSDAEGHLGSTLDALRSIGVQAEGHVGPHDPIQAADDGLRQFAADLLVFTTGPAEGANRLERDLLQVARDRYQVPVVQIVAEAAGQS